MPSGPGTDDLLARLDADGRLLRLAAERAGWDAPVPGLDWTVRDVVAHTGAVHRWVVDIVRRALPSNETGGSKAFATDVSDGELLDWFATGHAELVGVLRDTADDLEVWTFGGPAPARRFWARRQAHETAVHRFDVEAAAGSVTEVPAGFAQDGIDEHAGGFARQRAFAVAEPGTVLLAAHDGPSWLIRFGGERIEAAPTEETTADAVVGGSSSVLYRWVWNRPSPAVVSGDADVAARWRRVRVG